MNRYKNNNRSKNKSINNNSDSDNNNNNSKDRVIPNNKGNYDTDERGYITETQAIVIAV